MSSGKYGEGGKYLNLLIRLGIIMVLCILIGFLLGLFLDRQFNLKGIPIFIGVFGGVAGGFVFLFKEVMKLGDDDEN